MCACTSCPKKDKAFWPKEQTKGLTSCWMNANAAIDDLDMMCRWEEIEMVMKNKRWGNIKKTIQQGLVYNMVEKGAEGVFSA